MKPADVAMEPVAWTTADGLVRQCQVFRSRHLSQRDMLIAGRLGIAPRCYVLFESCLAQFEPSFLKPVSMDPS